jgi:CHAD domain-containing protein
MAYVLRHKRLGAEVRHVIDRQLEGALTALRTRPADAAPVHDARKRIKKVRAVVKLLREGLGRHYRLENDCLREAGRRLARLRDTDAIPAALAALRKKHAAITASDVHAIAHGLTLERRQAWADVGSVVVQAARTIGQINERLPRRAERAGSRAVIADGVVRGYRRAQEAFEALTIDAASDAFHAWRRRVKEHWYHVRLLEPWHAPFIRRARQLWTLESLLGDDHDLAVLATMLVGHPKRFGGEMPSAVVLGCIQQEQRKMRTRACKLGKRLFAGKPDRLERSVSRSLEDG